MIRILYDNYAIVVLAIMLIVAIVGLLCAFVASIFRNRETIENDYYNAMEETDAKNDE